MNPYDTGWLDYESDVDPKAFWPVCQHCYMRVDPRLSMATHQSSDYCRRRRDDRCEGRTPAPVAIARPHREASEPRTTRLAESLAPGVYRQLVELLEEIDL